MSVIHLLIGNLLMNDFTKEELESLLSTIKSLRVYTEIVNWDEDLEIKIQSMIDSYCEHEMTHETGEYLICIHCGDIENE